MASFQKGLKTVDALNDTHFKFVKSHYRDSKLRINSLFLRVQHLSEKVAARIFISDEEKEKVFKEWTEFEVLQSTVELLCSEYSFDYKTFELIGRYSTAIPFIQKFMKEHEITSLYADRKTLTPIRAFPFRSMKCAREVKLATIDSNESGGCEKAGSQVRTIYQVNDEKDENERGRIVKKAPYLTKSSIYNKTPFKFKKGFVNQFQDRRKISSKQTEISETADRNKHLKSPCANCNDENHNWFQCCRISPTLKRRKAHELRVCFVCLEYGHNAQDCSSDYKCVKCSGRHNVVLCTQPVCLMPATSTSEVKVERRLSDPTDYFVGLGVLGNKKRDFVFMALGEDSPDFFLPCSIGSIGLKALLDTGATVNLIPENLAAYLNLVSYEKVSEIDTARGILNVERAVKTDVKIGHFTKEIEFYLCPQIPVFIMGFKVLRDFRLILDYEGKIHQSVEGELHILNELNIF